MISGMLIAGLFLKLGEMAIEERHLEIGLKASEAAVGFGGGEKSLLIALKRNPENAEAILALARLKTKFTSGPEGKGLYEKAIRLLIAAQPQEAVEIFKEYYRKYFTGVEPQLLYRLAVIMERNLDMDHASRAYELLLKEPEIPLELRQRTLYQAAALLEKMEHDEAARHLFEQLLSEFPDAPAAAKARMKLGLPPEPADLRPPSPGPASTAMPGKAVTTPASASPGRTPDFAVNERICPSCNKRMVRRKAADGPHAGKHFWVCAEYPRCRSVAPT
jgi:tetratricopeptide (TPR) repeat protein